VGRGAQAGVRKGIVPIRMTGRPSAYPEHNPPSALAKLPDSGRATPDALVAQIQAVSQSPVVSALLEAVDAMLLVLNAERQIVAANDRATVAKPPDALLGERPGEALSCVNARAPAGCGTAPACLQCGALRAILASHERGLPVDSECLLRTETGATALELHVRATPITIAGHPFTVVSLRDVSAEKRRDQLEQIFLHDVMNTLGGLQGSVALLRAGLADARTVAARVERLSAQLEREFRDHRALVDAERGTLVPDPERVGAAELLAAAELVLSAHGSARDRRLSVELPRPDVAVQTDVALARRVLVNMGANALEATPAGGTVQLACDASSGAVAFRVENPGVISEPVQARIFQRSFSTKASRGRGLGTWSMKLLGERYLGGEVAFTSTAERGTVFTFTLPRAG